MRRCLPVSPSPPLRLSPSPRLASRDSVIERKGKNQPSHLPVETNGIVRIVSIKTPTSDNRHPAKNSFSNEGQLKHQHSMRIENLARSTNCIFADYGYGLVRTHFDPVANKEPKEISAALNSGQLDTQTR